MDAAVTRLTDALAESNSLLAEAALALEKHREIALRDELLKRVQANALLIRDVQS